MRPFEIELAYEIQACTGEDVMIRTMRWAAAAILVLVYTVPALGFCDGPCLNGDEIIGDAFCWFNGTCCSGGKCWTNGTCYQDGTCCWGNGTCCAGGKCQSSATCYYSNRLCCALGTCWENATCYQNGTCCAAGYCWSSDQARTDQDAARSSGVVISRERSLELLQEFSRTRERIDVSDRPRPRPRPGDQNGREDEDDRSNDQGSNDH